MEFRPCIDIHNGRVKQIVGASLSDEGDRAVENYVCVQDAAFFAEIYRRDRLRGGHVILLNAKDSEFYEATRRQAFAALGAYPGGLQAGGGITAENAEEFLEAGASHVIVTSYVFRNGEIDFRNLERIRQTVGKEHLVLDLSCRKRDGKYYIVTDRWQTYTRVRMTHEIIREIAGYCDEFLVHGVDVEGKASGIEEELVELLSMQEGIPITYAGGIGSLADLEHFRRISGGKLDFTIGSALDIFGGKIPYHTVKNFH